MNKKWNALKDNTKMRTLTPAQLAKMVAMNVKVQINVLVLVDYLELLQMVYADVN